MSMLIILVTCPNQSEAERIAEAVVGDRLAACVNVIPNIGSVYRWEGAVTRDTEWLLVIKSSQAQLDALQARVCSLHSYTVPEFIALPIVTGSSAYLDWMEENLGPSQNPPAE